jgi:1-acyl-sn-glycerol-3-phosphate acyltransferase
MVLGHWLARAAARRLPARERERLAGIVLADAGHGFDVFGMHRDGVAAAVWLTRLMHDVYFRVTAHGAGNIPSSGPAILAANHGGGLPFDAMMLYADVIAHTDPPRVPRPIADHFVSALPIVSTAFARAGVTSGSRANAERLLDQGEILMIFPEGTEGIGKPASARYQLQRWRVGHAELGMRHRAPVVPVAIIGPDDQWPQLGRLDWLHPFGAPFLPIPATPVPLPVRYHIHYGAPLALHEDGGDADDPDAVATAASRVAAEVERLLAHGLRSRRGLFA